MAQYTILVQNPSSEAQVVSLNIPVTLTLPVDLASESLPLLIFVSGFMLASTSYAEVVKPVADHARVAVLQYDYPKLRQLTYQYELEVSMLEVLLNAVKVSPAEEHAGLIQHIDFAHVAIGGHSRGGAISAFQLARNPTMFFTGILLDPVDLSDIPASSELRNRYHAFNADQRVHQSDAALKANGSRIGTKLVGELASRNTGNGVPPPVVTLGAGVIGLCNPDGRNYQQFFGALCAASRQVVLTQSGHMEFCSGASFWMRLPCKRGSTCAEEVSNLVWPLMSLWLQETLAIDGARRHRSYAELSKWMQDNLDSGVLTLAYKNEECETVDSKNAREFSPWEDTVSVVPCAQVS